MTSMTYGQPDGKATTIRKTFSRTTAVSIGINADRAIVWALLTNAADYARWNSTIISIEGDIMADAKIKLKSTLDPSRTFKLHIKEMMPEEKLMWGDSMGQRTFSLNKGSVNGVTFTMHEKIGGLMFPLFANKIPSFDASFEAFARDLKSEAEIIQKSSR
ncbi:MAG: SRPBCC domain-containing protein [Saprospiraceae bacterium]|nr:SRPBCC domain-containing protein [Saprospiraceae bacterium]